MKHRGAISKNHDGWERRAMSAKQDRMLELLRKEPELDNEQLAERLGVDMGLVWTWRKRAREAKR